MIKGIDADLVPLDSCSQPVFKWSSLLLFHFPRSASVPEIMNCSNSNFNLGLEAWSFMTPWSSSNSLLLPTGLPLSHPVVQALLLLLLCQLQCLQYLSLFFFSPSELLLCWQKTESLHWEVRWARGQCEQRDYPFWHQQALRSPLTSHGSAARCILANADSCCQQQSCHLPPQVPRSSRVPVLEGLLWSLLNWIEELVRLKYWV